MYDVAIIGGGVVGGLIARKLSFYKLSTVVLEKENDVALGATKANSAIVHAGFDAKEGSLKAELNVKGSKMMAKVAADLGVKYLNNGSLVIGFNDEDRATLEELLKRGKANGVEALRIIDRDELLKLEPNIGDGVKTALLAETGAIVCPYELTVAAIGNAMDNGAELKTRFEVVEITKAEDSFKIKAQTNEELSAKYVINAAGVYSDKIAKMVGDDSFTITPRKGEYILLDKECSGHISHTIFRTPSPMGKGILVTPTVDNNLLLGPTSIDITDKTDTDTTKEGFDKILKEAAENVKNIPFRKTITSFSGLRATGSTGDFVIGRPMEGFINVAAIESPGLSASPAIAEYVFELLLKAGLKADLKENYTEKRKPAHWFKELSLEKKKGIIKEDPSFGKIVCRCETVTEGEILEAIRTNPRPTDLDGVKRRTRAQMGRCQGGFCSPYIVKMLAEELKIDFCDVTKFGGDSVINLSKTKEEK